MEWIRVGLALGLPWLVGVLWLRVLWRDKTMTAGAWPLSLGYGYVLGLLIVTVLLRMQNAMGWPLNFASPAIALILLMLVSGWWLRRSSSVTAQLYIEAQGPDTTTRWPQILFGLLLMALVVRLTGLALEVWWRPLYPWDAWTTWAVQPRVWAELQQMVPFTSPQHWLADANGSAYAIEAWNYPKTVPLLALWPTLAFGGWNETAANLPWLGCLLALGLGFYGQARVWGASPLTALIFTWLLLSLPLLDTHVALAGYADLWMATVFSLAVIAFIQWARDGDPWQGFLALTLALAGPLIKVEGAVWLLLFAPMLLAARLRGRTLWVVSGLAMLIGVGWWLIGGTVFSIPGLGEFHLTPHRIQVPYIGQFTLGYRGSWNPVVMNFLVMANWHLLWYLALATLGVALNFAIRHGLAAWQRAELTFIVASLLALFVLFFMTDAQRWAEQYTSINRVLLDFAPAFLFCILTAWVAPRPAPVAAKTSV